MPQSPRITVTIPVYNGAKYLAETIGSLSKQIFQDFEVICADDCSTDGSLQVLQDLARAEPRLRVLSTPHNFGFAAPVLNFIVEHARGERIVYSSQDDFFSPDWLAKMISRADETGADVVIPDLVFFHPTAPVARPLIGVRGDRSRIISGREAVELSLDWTIPGNGLYRTSMWRDLKFPTFGAWADEYAVRLFFLHCRTVAFSEGTFYYRQDNPNAITKKFSLKRFDVPKTEIYLLTLLRDNNFPEATMFYQLMKTMQMVVNLDADLRAKPAAIDTQVAREKLDDYLADFRQPWIKGLLRSQWRKMSLRQKALALTCTQGNQTFYLGAVAGMGIRSMKRAWRRARPERPTHA